VCLFGCSNPKNNIQVGQPSGYKIADITTHFFEIECTVAQINMNSNRMLSVIVKFVKNLPNGVGYEPFTSPGELIDINFNQMIDINKLSLTNGSILRLKCGQVENSTNWVSNLAWVKVKKGGIYFSVDY
jgi:hypothetical protein